jgi:hypothetical protein
MEALLLGAHVRFSRMLEVALFLTIRNVSRLKRSTTVSTFEEHKVVKLSERKAAESSDHERITAFDSSGERAQFVPIQHPSALATAIHQLSSQSFQIDPTIKTRNTPSMTNDAHGF